MLKIEIDGLLAQRMDRQQTQQEKFTDQSLLVAEQVMD